MAKDTVFTVLFYEKLCALPLQIIRLFLLVKVII